MNTIKYVFQCFLRICIVWPVCVVWSHAETVWEPTRQLTTPPIAASELAYNHGRAIRSYGDTISIVFISGNTCDLYLLRSLDGGETWDSPLPTGEAWLLWPALAIGNAGEVHISAFTYANHELLYVRSLDAGLTWDAETLVVLTGGWRGEGSPSLQVDPDNNVHIVYTITNGSATEVYYMRSSDSGSTWQGPLLLIPTQPYHAGPWIAPLACDDKGELHIVVDVAWYIGDWYCFTSYLKSPDQGSSWDTLEIISGPMGAGTGRYSLDACGTGDTLAFVWPVHPEYAIYLSGSTDGGNAWVPKIQLSEIGAGNDYFPVISFDPCGGIHVVWEDWGLWGVAYRYVSPDWTPDSSIERLSDLSTIFRHPHIHCDAQGRVHAVWTQPPDDVTPAQVYYKRGYVETSIDEHAHGPKRESALVYPTVFKNTCTIQIPQADRMRLTIYDISGQLVKTLSSQSTISDLKSTMVWDGSDNDSRRLPSGVYFIHLKSEAQEISHKVLLIR